MKKLFILFFALLFGFANAEVLEAGVSIEEVPKALYGGWRITAHLDTTNAHSSFKPQSLDFWTLSRVGDSISLDNPMSGANSTISVKTVEGNLIVFSKKTPYSLIDNHLMKTETAKYIIKGEKISGDSILN